MSYVAFLLGSFAICQDLARRRLSNILVVAGLCCGVVLHAAGGGWRGLAASLAGTALGFVILLPLYLAGGLGGGDVKLMAAFGALLGPSGVLLAALLSAIFGGMWAAASSLAKPRATAIPFAPAIVLAAWISWFGGGV